MGLSGCPWGHLDCANGGGEASPSPWLGFCPVQWRQGAEHSHAFVLALNMKLLQAPAVFMSLR